MKHKSTIKRIIHHREASGLVKQPMIAMLFLLGILFILAITALFYIAGRQNAHEDEHFHLLMGKAIENRQEIMHSHTIDNADWGEAYENLHLTINTEWAWDNQNLGASLYQTFHYEGIFVISPDGQTRYSVINGKLNLQLVESWLGKDPVPRLKQLLGTAVGKAVSTLMVSEGQVTLLSAAWISPGGDSSVITDNGPRSLMIFADRLTPEKLNKMALEYGIHGAHILSPQAPRPGRQQPADPARIRRPGYC